MKKALLIVIGLMLAAVVAFALYVFVGGRLAAGRAERSWRKTTVQPLMEIGTTSQLGLVPLFEEAGDSSRYQIDHGLSYLIRVDGGSVLLDVGFSENTIEPLPVSFNMEQATISPDEIAALVFSHFHADHSGGVEAWRQGEANLAGLAGALADVPIFIASEFSVPKRQPKLAAEPTMIIPGVATTGAIEYVEPFPIFLFHQTGFEQGLVIQLENSRLVLITGCGHPTVERMVERAEALFGAEVIAVVGGVHSDGLSKEEIQADIQFLKDQNIEFVAISPHDSGPEALAEYAAAFGEGYRPIRVGERIEIH